MFIRRLEIFGFKSFKNKTVLEFDNRKITGIVGPNGCGKSNVVDALLWVMGENSPKNLRGESLSDVIFGGTTKESPGNLAEVTLNLDKGESGFPENYKNFSEVMITRRSYRDGKNEYLINNQPCLLRDIREFFMNTGAGCRGFSIIEQEAIERLITAKPLQRRFIIEEAAGITKFKNRKQESIRKLDLVNHNLQRINDILKNQESQLHQLSHQAKKAEQYKKWKQELEKRQGQMARREQEDVFCNYQNLKTDQGNLESEKEKLLKKSKDFHRQVEQEQAQIQGIEKAIEKAQQEELNQKMKSAGLLDKIKVFEMIEGIKVKKAVLQEKENSIQEDLLQVQDFFKGKSHVEEFEKESGQIQGLLTEIQQNKKEAEIQISSLKKQMDFVDKESEQLEKDKEVIQADIQKTINDKNQVEALLYKYEKAGGTFKKDISDLNEKEKALIHQQREWKEQLDQWNQKVSILEHKREDRQKMISRFSSLNEGAEDLKKWKPEDFQPLFQNLKIKPDYASVLGAVLGPYVYALIPKEDICIEQGVQRLKKQKKGRSSFLSQLPVSSVSSSSKKELRTYPAFDCFLDEKVSWNIHIEALRSFLEQVVVVSDFSSAWELKKQFPDFQFVTKEGDLITRDSFVYAGSSDKETGLLEIRSQIDECLKEISALKIKIQAGEVDFESCTEKLRQTQGQIQSLSEKQIQNHQNIISIKKDRERMEKDIVRLSESRRQNDQKAETLYQQKQNLLQHENSGRKEIQGLEDVLSVKETRLKDLKKELEEYEAQNFKKNKWEKELLDNKKDQENMDKEISLLLHLAGEGKESEDEEGSKASSLNLEKRMAGIRRQKEEMSEQLEACQKSRKKQQELKLEQERSIQSLKDQIHQVQLDLSRLDSDWDKKELEKAHLRGRFQEKYKLQIEDFVSSVEETSLEKLKEEVDQYQRKLDRIGGVNFLALEDYEKLSKENFFLNEQKEDLVQSRKEIMKVISHIDKLCESRFYEMLEEINKRFEKVFPVVFQGDNAKAQLILHKSPEGQEDGLDILIHPPGKRPQSVGLLSRGEKALTAICLIYSLFLVKPSPFCIIDEADAPLDDANIFRFLSVLKEMAENSQIIAITHNKYTMQSCKKLYGVTMEQPGISQIVSVDMESPRFLSEASPD